MQIDLSIIIVSYNTKELTENCINSIIKSTHVVSYEIIVVDNASIDGSVELFRRGGPLCPPVMGQTRGFVPTIKLIENKENLGYAKANNLGIKIAKGKSILLLNSDTIIQEGSIDEAYKHLKEADVLTINLKNEDMTNQQAAGFNPNLFNVFCWAFFIDDLPFVGQLVKPYQISRVSYFNKSHVVDWVMGAFFMMKKQVVERIGLLDEKIFMYGEEMEFCHRAKKAGFKVKYFNFPFIIHLGRGSSESSEGAVLGEYKAMKYYFSKYYSKFFQKILSIILYSSIILRIIIFSLLRSNRAKIYEKAFKSI